jgi:predicted NBD/HSP70 family sugar kinase
MVERFIGLDVSQRSTSICILDGQGNRVWRGKCATDPAAIEEVIRARAGSAARIGLGSRHCRERAADALAGARAPEPGP